MEDKTNKQLIRELTVFKDEIARLKAFEADHRTLQEELAEQRRQYLDLANTSPAGIYRIRVIPTGQRDARSWTDSGNPPYFFEFFNDQFCRILRVDRRVPEENPDLLLDFIIDEDKSEWARLNIKANAELAMFEWEGRLCIEDQIKWVHLESLPRRLANKDVLWTGIMYEITERKKKEQIIKDNAKRLRRLNTEKDKFFSIIAHDLNSPLNTIAGFSRILTEQVRKKNLDEIEKYAEIIANASHNASNLLMNLIEWALSQSGVVTYNPGRFDLVDTIDDTWLYLSDAADQKSIDLVRQLPCSLPVFADKSMVRAILRNLVSNAIKFTEPGGQIKIGADFCNEGLTVSVSDNGLGISKGRIEKLFNLGENRSTPGTRNERGTGLGLILCREFVRKHNGDIWIESESGKGTTCFFTLPAKEA